MDSPQSLGTQNNQVLCSLILWVRNLNRIQPMIQWLPTATFIDFKKSSLTYLLCNCRNSDNKYYNKEFPPHFTLFSPTSFFPESNASSLCTALPCYSLKCTSAPRFPLPSVPQGNWASVRELILSSCFWHLARSSGPWGLEPVQPQPIGLSSPLGLWEKVKTESHFEKKIH